MSMQKFHSRFTVKVFICCLFLVAGAQSIRAGAVGDYDGDGKTDFAVVRRNDDLSLTWFILQSRDGFRAADFGRHMPDASVDIPFVPGDYDGDGKNDLAIFRRNPDVNQPTPAYWYFLKSSDHTLSGGQWGLTNDNLAQGDYDGDGKTDFAVYRRGIWYISQSRDGFYAAQFGLADDTPLGGNDYDGDGKDDLAVVRRTFTSPSEPMPTVLYVRLSGSGTLRAWNMGDARSTWVVSGDYDGDGKSDAAGWNHRDWFWIRSSDNQVEVVTIGQPSDSPLPGDYDGDGKTDPAIFKFGTEYNYYILQSRDGFKAVQWGRYPDLIIVNLRGLGSVGI